MTEMLLLGAGASVEAGVPHSFAMTSRILEEFQKEDRHSQASQVLQFVIGGLLFQKGIQGHNPLRSGINVEDLFNAVRLLAERHTLEAAPFVGSWHAMVEQFDTAEPEYGGFSQLYESIHRGIVEHLTNSIPQFTSGFSGHHIDNAIGNSISQAIQSAQHGYFSSGLSHSVSRELEDYVKNLIKEWLGNVRFPNTNWAFDREFKDALSRRLESGKGRIFDRIGEQMIVFLTNIVWIEKAESVRYLEPILRLQARQRRLVIGTLNYDNAVETLAGSTAGNVSCSTGIDDWLKSGAFDLNGDGILLLKLHGSIDWLQGQTMSTSDRPIPQYSFTRANDAQMKQRGFRPAVIFGQRNKLTAQGPFLDLLRGFQRELAAADLLTVVGYSFRDDHINTVIGQWINQNKAHRLRVIDPSFGDDPPEFVQMLLDRCKSRLEVLKEPAGQALDALYPPMSSSYPPEGSSVSAAAPQNAEVA